MKILKDLKTKEDELLIENETHRTEYVENKTSLHERLYNFLQCVFLTV